GLRLGPGGHNFFSSSFFSSPSFIDDLKFRIPSPKPLPSAANLLGPNSSRAIATIKMISVRPIFPSMMTLLESWLLLGWELDYAYGNSRPQASPSQKLAERPHSLLRIHSVIFTSSISKGNGP